MRHFALRPVRRPLAVLSLPLLLAAPALAGENHGTKGSCALRSSGEAKAHAHAGEQWRAISELRDVGTAMFAWYVDALDARHQAELPKSDEPPPTTMRFDSVPAISHAELAELLVPKYLAAVPEKDPWDNPYEFRLSTANLGAPTIMGLRSAGCDGKTAGETYTIGAFASADTAQDLVWMDGFFVRWPERQE